MTEPRYGEWTKTDELVPSLKPLEPGPEVIGASDDSVEAYYYTERNGEALWYYADGRSALPPKHWMPMPPHPSASHRFIGLLENPKHAVGVFAICRFCNKREAHRQREADRASCCDECMPAASLGADPLPPFSTIEEFEAAMRSIPRH